MANSVDLYEALKPTVEEEAARMVAEALPISDRVATRLDIDQILSTMATKADLSALEARIFRWMLGFFATLWLSNAGVIITLLVRG
jgi:hypothetical protein